jgi:hypothetical protein
MEGVMKYEEIVAKVKKAYAKADTALVDEHLAVQVDVTGEGEGAFYIEVADGKINVEPWEYLDHDFKIQCTAEEIIAIAEGKKKLGAEVESGNVYISRNFDKVAVFDLIVAKKSAKKAAAPKAEKTAKKAAPKAEKKTAEKKVAKKDTAAAAAKKEAEKAAKAAEKAAKKEAEKAAKAAEKAAKKEAEKAAKAAEKAAKKEAEKAAKAAAKAVKKTADKVEAKDKKKPGRKPKNAEVKA